MYIWSSIHSRQPVAGVSGSRPSASVRPGSFPSSLVPGPKAAPGPGRSRRDRHGHGSGGAGTGRAEGLCGGQLSPAPTPGQAGKGKYTGFPGAKQLG